MPLQQRAFAGDASLREMEALAAAYPAANLHVIDLPWRLCSWALDEPGNIGLWHNAAGALRGWVVVQTPFWCIDIVLHPQDEAEFPRLLAWAQARASALHGGAYARPAWFVNVPAGQPARQQALEAAGFVNQADHPEQPWSEVLMQHNGQPAPDSRVSEAVTIRPLSGPAEVAGYVACHRAVFQSDSMRVEWRARTVLHPAYQADLDLLAIDERGRVAGFCVCWLNGEGGQIEPLGVHPEFQGRGLGRALLSEGLRRLQARGAQRILVITDNFRNAARTLYESVGFQVIEPVWVYRKDGTHGQT